ncbi:hemolysin D [Aureimonas sp. Leaf454]|uniref:efflux RND transporter periplasmic adaptor subunit n=1 Tax=Aureimonas sp. Leaf454 TaxID=1736381 RepID=UPI0006FD1946|nr:efflux RND transporter periplasmic adaptor subunit [Aureimonas sp. Leaf454]KQT47396.1 hemolysin D [Aureimonas sp. Leaf454]
MKLVKFVVTLGVVVVLGIGADMAWRNRVSLPSLAATETPAVAAPAAPPPMPVPTVAVVKKTVPVVLDYAARTEAIRSVALQSKVGGFVSEQLFPDGADVAAGALLYRLDSRDFEATLAQASAVADRDAAALDYARATSERSSSLVQSGSLARDTADLRVSTRRQAEAALAISRAAIRSAELNLGYTEIRAPFAGRLSRDKAPVGTLIGAGGMALNTLVQLDPIYVTFNPSEGDLAEIVKARGEGPVSVTVTLPGVDGLQHEGELSFVDNMVDPQTGTISARATIRNKTFLLLPGQYVRASLKIRDEPGVLMVPSVAVGSGQLGKYVYVIGKDNKVEQKAVTLGQSEGDLVVAEGIAEGDRIITGNLQKIGAGMPVQPMPATVASK